MQLHVYAFKSIVISSICSNKVYFGFNIQLRRQLTFVCSRKLNSKDTVLSHINTGHLGGTLWIYINGSRVVHLGFNVRLRRQLSMKINMPKSSLTTQNVVGKNLTQKILNYLCIKPRTPWGHTMDIYKLVLERYPGGRNIQFWTEMCTEMKVPKKALNHTKVKEFWHMLNLFMHKPRDTLRAH